MVEHCAVSDADEITTYTLRNESYFMAFCNCDFYSDFVVFELYSIRGFYLILYGFFATLLLLWEFVFANEFGEILAGNT